MSFQPHVGQGFSTAPCMERPSQPRHRAGMAGMAQSAQVSRAGRLQSPTAPLTPWAPSQGWCHCCSLQPRQQAGLTALLMCPCPVTRQGLWGCLSRAAGCPADTAATGRALWGLPRDERARSQQPSCLPHGAGHIPLPRAFPNSPLPTGCPKLAASPAPASPQQGHRAVQGSCTLLGTHTPLMHLSTGPEG